MTVDGSKVDVNKAGVYEVTYTYDGVTSTAKVTVKDKQTPTPNQPSGSGKSDQPKTEPNVNEVTKDNSKKEVLPKTGETSGMMMSVIGIFLLELLGVVSFFKIR